MGSSHSKGTQQTREPSTEAISNDAPNEVVDDERLCSQDDESFVFINKDLSCSVSSAEEALTLITSQSQKIPAQPVNVTLPQENNRDNSKEITTNCEAHTCTCSSKEDVNDQDLMRVDNVCRKESDPIDIILNTCAVAEGGTFRSNSEIQNKTFHIETYSPSGICSTGKEEWIQINGKLDDFKLIDIYEIFSNYGSISAIAKTKDHIYIKFSSWAGIANVFDDIKNIKHLQQFTSIIRVEYDALQNHPERSEIYLNLPNCVLAYLKDHTELCRALVVISMTASDNFCFNAPKIQQVVDKIRNSVCKGFQQCTVFPFGCHVLGSCDLTEPLEIFVDTGDMYAGCHKQGTQEQIAICKQVRKLLSDNVNWYSGEESPVAVFFHCDIALKCILYFDNGLGDRCTRLLGIFMDYDERFRVLFLLLDLWSKQCSLQGIWNGISSYIVAVLLVFYLQALPVPLLPPLQRIRQGRPVVIKGWDCTFTEDASTLPRNECSTEVPALLRGFFVFYGNYDWNRVVSPLLGQSVDRKTFSSPSAPFPDDPLLANYLRALSDKTPNTTEFATDTSMCVQDFFNLSENIAKGVSADTLLRFQTLCRQSHKMIYSAESKLSFGPSSSPKLPRMPYPMPSLRRRDQYGNDFQYPTKFGSMGDRSPNWHLHNENGHGEYSHSSDTKDGLNLYRHPHPRRPTFKQKTNNNNYDSRSFQVHGVDNSREKITEYSPRSRPYRGRVFWHNSAKHKVP